MFFRGSGLDFPDGLPCRRAGGKYEGRTEDKTRAGTYVDEGKTAGYHARLLANAPASVKGKLGFLRLRCRAIQAVRDPRPFRRFRNGLGRALE